jgi:hypothetical protein
MKQLKRIKTDTEIISRDKAKSLSTMCKYCIIYMK